VKSKKIYIFIPGYYGSTLMDPKSRRLIWGDTKEIFFSRSTLAMPIPNMRVPGALNLEPHSLIPDKQVLGGLLKEDAYDKTIAFLKNTNAEEVFPVAWDWRRDPYLGVLRLDQTVKLAKEKYPHHELILVSHSYGSLMASYFLRFGTQDYFNAIENWEGLKHFSKIILSASPFRGTMTVFRNMLNGIKFGLNHNMQTPLAFCTFESSYYLLPPPGFDLVRDQFDNSLSLNLHDPMNWINNSWGLFHEKLKLSSESFEARKTYITNHLSRALKLHQLIDSPINFNPPQKKSILYLSGHGSKTLHQGVWLRNIHKNNVFLYYPKDFKKWKLKLRPASVYGEGDSTIPDFSLELPQAFKALDPRIIHEKRGHLDSLQHKNAHQDIYDFINTK